MKNEIRESVNLAKELKNYIESFIPEDGYCADFEYFNTEMVIKKLKTIIDNLKNL